MISNDKYCTRAEVAKLLRITPRCVAEIKELKPIRINSRLLRYRVRDVELWLKELAGRNR